MYKNLSLEVVGGFDCYISCDEIGNTTLPNEVIDEMFNLSSSG